MNNLKSVLMLIIIAILYCIVGCSVISSGDPTATSVSISQPMASPSKDTTVEEPKATFTFTAIPIPSQISTQIPTAPEALSTAMIEPMIPSDLQEIRIDNIQNLTVIAEIPYPQAKPDHLVFAMQFSNDGKKMVIRSENWRDREKALVVWDLINNSEVFAIEDPPYALGIYFSPDNDQLWMLRENFLDQYALQDGTLVNSISIPEFSESAVAISPDGKWLVTGVYNNDSQDSVVNFYLFENLELYFTQNMPYMIMSFSFSPDSSMIAGHSAKLGTNVTKIWELKSGKLLKDFINYHGPTFSPDSTLAVFSKENQFFIYNTETWGLEASFQNDNTTSTNFPAFVLADGKIVAIQQTASVTFTDVNSSEEIFGLPGQTIVANYSPILNIIASNTNLENIKIWAITQ